MEPMDLGSPGNSPSSNQSQYLPPFLMGDPQAFTPPDRYNVSFATSPSGGSSPYEFNRSTLNSRAGGLGHNGHTYHQEGPPTVGLFDSLGQPIFTPRGNHLSRLQMQSPNQSYQSYQSSYHTNDSYPPMRALRTPERPTTTSLDSGLSTANVDSSDLWVTIFGYQSGNITQVLQHFTFCNSIVNVVRAPQNGNWMHVRYSSPAASEKALSYNHKVIDGNVMVGVMRCTDRFAVSDTEKRLAMGNQNMASREPRQLNRPAENNSDESSVKEEPHNFFWLVKRVIEILF